MHPRIASDIVLSLAARAALALERGGHGSGVGFSVEVEWVAIRGFLRWPEADLKELEQHDQHRITEDGAEAVALAVAHQHRGWRVIRRMQRKEHADWLLEQPGNGRRKVVALEVSGIEQGNLSGRLREKLRQVAKSAGVDQRWASVVEFSQPQAVLRSTKA